MTENSFNQLILRLAAGHEEAARNYLLRLPREQRVPKLVREGLADRVAPEVMEYFLQLAPWLNSDDVDDAPQRIRSALQAVRRAGLSRSELRAKVAGVEPERIRQVLDAMVQSREVHIERKRTAARSADVFRLSEFARGIIPANEGEDPFAFQPLRPEDMENDAAAQ
jgi:hypothetical protein